MMLAEGFHVKDRDSREEAFYNQPLARTGPHLGGPDAVTSIAQPGEASATIAGTESWHGLDRAFERLGRDWAIVSRCVQDLPCVVCGRPTRLMVSFSPRAVLPICASCRGY
jgi:hypothetical protein